MPPLLSICIPAYNNPTGLLALVANLRQRIEAAGAQAWVEVCISDDASPDASGAKQTKEQTFPFPVQTKCQAQNLGFSKNLMFTANMAQGKYLAFAGDDDLFDETTFPQLASILASDDALIFLRTMPDYPLSMGLAKGAIPTPLTQAETIGNPSELLLKLGLFHATFIGNFIVRRDLFLAHAQEADTLSLYPHYAVLLRILKRHPARFLPQPLLVFNGGGLRWNQPLLSAVDLARLLTLHFKTASDHATLDLAYARLARSIPRALLNARRGRPANPKNPHQSLSLANVLNCYSGQIRHQCKAGAYWLAGRCLPRPLLEKALGKSAAKVHYIEN